MQNYNQRQFCPSRRGFSDQLQRLRENDHYLDSISLRFNVLESDASQHFPHWRDAIFTFQISQWIEAIQLNNTVESATVDLTLPDNTIWEKNQCRNLLNAVGALPCLGKLVLRQNELGEPPRMRSISAIANAVENTRLLTHFELWGQTIREGEEEDLEALSRTIQLCRHLECVKILGLQLSENHVRIFSPILQMQSLKELSLGNTSGGFFPLIEMLPLNTTLESLTLGFKRNLDDAIVLRLGHVLQENRNLLSLALLNAHRKSSTTGISKVGYKALLAMVEQNHVLQFLKLPGSPDADIEFFLKLNRAGRRQLFHEGATREDWVDMIMRIREDVDCVFYLLVMNPTLCDVRLHHSASDG